MPTDAPGASLAIVNARVWTGDARRPWGDAVLIVGDGIDAVGSSAEVRKRAATGTRVLDARGMLVTPASTDPSAGDGATLAAVHAAMSHRARGAADAPRVSLGVLRAGSPADLMMIDRDLTRLAPASLREARIVLRLDAGRVVHDPGGLATP